MANFVSIFQEKFLIFSFGRFTIFYRSCKGEQLNRGGKSLDFVRFHTRYFRSRILEYQSEIMITGEIVHMLV